MLGAAAAAIGQGIEDGKKTQKGRTHARLHVLPEDVPRGPKLSHVPGMPGAGHPAAMGKLMMTREQMIDEAVRRSFSGDGVALRFALRQPVSAMECAARAAISNCVRAEFRRIDAEQAHA